MRTIDLSSIGLSAAGFRDGLGERLLGFDRAAGETLELLRVRPELATLEAVLLARVGHLTGFRNVRFLGLRGVAKNCTRTFIVSNHIESERLSEVLARAHARRIVPGVALTLHIVKEILQALVMLERSHKTAHGAVGPERILVTPRGRIMLAEHMLAPALQRLAFSPPFLWREMRIAMPAKPSPPRFDARADIAQVAMLMLALGIGRPLQEDEFPDNVRVLAGDVREAVAKWGGADLADAIGTWLEAALPVHRRTGGFASTAEAQLKLEQSLAKVAASIGSAQGLEAFLARLDAPDSLLTAPPETETVAEPSLTVIEETAAADSAVEMRQPIAPEPEPAPAAPSESALPLPASLEAETAEVGRLLDELLDQAAALTRTQMVDTPEPERLEASAADAPPVAPGAIEAVPALDVSSIEPARLEDEFPLEEMAPLETISVTAEAVHEPDEVSAIDVVPALAALPPVGIPVVPETPPIVEAAVVVKTEPVAVEWPVFSTTPPSAVEPVVEEPPADVVSSKAIFDFTVPPPAPPPVESPQPEAVAPSPPTAATPAPPPQPATVSDAAPRLITDADLSKIPDWMVNPDESAAVAPTPAERPPVTDGSLWRETVVAPMRPAPEPVEAPAPEDDPLERARRILQADQRKREAAEALEALEAERAAEEEARARTRRLLVRVAAAISIAALCAGGGFLGWRWWKARTAPGTLIVESQPPGSEVLVDGQARGKTPASLTLPPGLHALELRLGDRTSNFDVRVPAGGSVTQALNWSTQIDAGSLTVTSEPDGARVSVDGQVRGKTPLELTDVPAGRHTVVVTTARGTVTEHVTVQRNEVATVHASVYSGWLAVFAPVELQIFERNRLIGTTSDGRIMVTPGRHQIDLVNEELGYRATETFTVRPGEVSSISIEPKGQVNVNATPWAEVFVDGQRLGETPIANAPVTVGIREFVFKHPDYGERRVTVTVTLKETTRVNVDMTKE